jgi:hypothetical protein
MTLKKVYKKLRTAIIYEIVCLTTGERYIGSTVKPLEKRLKHHEYYSFKHPTKQCESKKILLRKNYKCNELERFKTRFKLPVLLKEQYYIDKTENINKMRALDLYKKFSKKYQKKWSKENREHLYKYHKNWSINNEDKIKKHRKKYKTSLGKINCDCGGRYRNDNYSKNRHFQSIKHKKYLNSL